MGNAWGRHEGQQWFNLKSLLCGCTADAEASQPIYQQLTEPTLEDLHTRILEIIEEMEELKKQKCCCRQAGMHEGYMQMRPFPPPRLPDQEEVYKEWLQERREW